MTLVAASDGNHGRAVAKFSRLQGHPARIFVPDGVHPAAVQAIRDEGAERRRGAGRLRRGPSAPRTATPPTRAGSFCRTRPGTATRRCPAGSWPATPRSSVSSTTSLPDLGIDRPDLVLVPTGGRIAAPGRSHPLPGRRNWCGDPAVVFGRARRGGGLRPGQRCRRAPGQRRHRSHDHGRPQLRHGVQPRLAVDPPRARCRRHRHRRRGDLGRPGPRHERRPRRGRAVRRRWPRPRASRRRRRAR